LTRIRRLWTALDAQPQKIAAAFKLALLTGAAEKISSGR